MAAFEVIEDELGADVFEFFGRLVTEMTLIYIAVAARTFPFSAGVELWIPLTSIEHFFASGTFPETLTFGRYSMSFLFFVAFLLFVTTKAIRRSTGHVTMKASHLDVGFGTVLAVAHDAGQSAGMS